MYLPTIGLFSILLKISIGPVINAQTNSPTPVTKKPFSLTYNHSDKCAVKFVGSQNSEAFPYVSTNPMGPMVECSYLPENFIECEDPLPVQNYGSQSSQTPQNTSYKDEGRCTKMGGHRAEDIEFTNVKCRVLSCIECHGPREFQRLVPCIKFTGHYFLSTLLYSIFLGIVAVDRFCLGYSAMAVGKLMTLGGFGIWWIVDIFLLVFGNLTPADDSNWEPYY